MHTAMAVGLWLAAVVLSAGTAAAEPGVGGQDGRTVEAAAPEAVGLAVSVEVAELLAGDAAAEDHFGRAVAVSGDMLVVGAPLDDDAGSGSGAAYVFERNQGGTDAWGQVAKLIASDAAAADTFGVAVAIDGATIAIGASSNDGAAVNAGAVYVFERNQGGADAWGQVAKLTASDAATGDNFGVAVAIDGPTVVAGAPLNDVSSFNSGAAYVFHRNEGGADAWGEVRRITPTDPAAEDWFGQSVGIDGAFVVVGAPFNDDPASNTGSVYVFERNQGGSDNWGQVRKLLVPDRASGDRLGDAVAIHGDLVLAGSPFDDDAGADSGSAYVFSRHQGGTDNWGQVVKLGAAAGDAGDRFGFTLALGDATALVRGYLDDALGLNAGAAHLFGRNQGGADVWGELKRLEAGDGAGGDFYGYGLDLDGDTLAVGAYLHDQAAPNAGAVWVYQLLGNAWREVAEATANDAATGDWLGFSVDLDGSMMAAGARRDSADSGSVYVFGRNQGGTDGWGQIAKLRASAAGAGDFYGVDVAVDGDHVMVGADGDFNVGAQAGTVWVNRRDGPFTWTQVRFLGAPDAAAGDRFGRSLDLDGEVLVVGAWGKNGTSPDEGAAYVFHRNQTLPDWWDFVAKLTASDAAILDWLGLSVGVSGDTVVAGAPSNLGSEPGAAYLFRRNQGGADAWGQIAQLAPADGAGGDKFGDAVAISGDLVVVGARLHDGAATDAGAVYLFGRNQGGADAWGQIAKLSASDAAAGDEFGARVALDGDTLVVGARLDDDAGASSGAAYVFERNQGGADAWGQVAKLTASDGAAGDRFGEGVAVSGQTVVAGATFGDAGGVADSGSAYVFERFAGCRAGRRFVAGQWRQLSLACDAGGADTVATVFGDELDPADYGSRWTVYRWNPTTEAYEQLALGDPLEEGRGYWLKTLDAGQGVDANGDANPVLDHALVADAAVGRWNMAGHPFPFPVCWADALVVDGAAVLSLDQADPVVGSERACSLDPPDPSCVMSRVAYSWNGAAYDAFDGETPGTEGALEAFEGLWVRAFKSGIALRIPAVPSGSAGCSAAESSAPSAPSSARLAADRRQAARSELGDEAADWSGRLVAASGALRDAAVFGRLAGSRTGPDRHDLPELSPFGEPYLTVVFPHPEWGDRAGDYASDYRPAGGGVAAHAWRFDLLTSEPGLEVTLTWQAPAAVLRRSRLVDLETGRAVDLTPGGQYTFTLDGSSRSFRWRLGGPPRAVE